jgi:flagellar hook-associated protein FlgK
MQTFTSRPAPPAPRPRLHPALRELVVEASQALARLDADRLEELVLCCQALTREQALTQEPPRESALDSARESTRESTRALNRDLLPIKEAERLRLAAEARDARGDMAVFARVLEASLANQAIVSSQSPTDFYSNFATSLGSTVAQVQTENTAQTASVTQLQTQNDALSAVNLNDEASSMTVLERSYQAAAQVFSMLDSVMASALNLGEETTVS